MVVTAPFYRHSHSVKGLPLHASLRFNSYTPPLGCPLLLEKLNVLTRQTPLQSFSQRVLFIPAELKRPSTGPSQLIQFGKTNPTRTQPNLSPLGLPK